MTRVGNNCNDTSTKFLDIFMDENLTWRDHISYINSKIARTLFSIKQVKNVLPRESLKTLYLALIQPHISYGILAWGNANQTHLSRTLILQKRAIRTITRSNYNSHTDPLFRSSKILKLSDLYEFQASLFMFDYLLDRLPHSFRGIFKLNHEIQQRETRQSNKLYVARCESKFSLSLPLYNFPKIWNKLSKIITESTSRYIFKKNLKSTLIQRYSRNVKCRNRHCRDCRH